MSLSKGLRLSPQAIAAQLALRKVPSPFGHPSYGKGGRQSVAGITAAVFGSTGFVGRYVLGELGTRGCKVFAPYRGCEMEGRHLKTNFDLGNLGQMAYSTRDEDSIRDSIRNSDVVINLIGKYYETKHLVPTRRADGSLSNINYDFEEVNCTIPATIARIAKEQGVKSLIHVSALSASPDSDSKWSRTKFAGEIAVREQFPEAIVVRPAHLFGAEDLFLNWFAEMAALMPVIPLVNGGENLTQPVYAPDVAKAITALIYNWEDFQGSTVLLGGPEQRNYRELIEFVLDVAALHNRTLVSVPTPIINTLCKFSEKTINPYFTTDNLKQMLEDNVITEEMQLAMADCDKTNTFGFQHLGITPVDMASVSYDFLGRFRAGGHFRRIQGYH